MNTNLYKFIIFFILVLLSACGQDTETAIQKKWKLDAKIFVQKIEKKTNTKLEDDEKAGNLNFANSLYVDFQPDGVVETNLGGRTQKGTWELNEDKDKVILSRKEGKEILKIVEISRSKLVLEHTDKNIKDNWILVASE